MSRALAQSKATNAIAKVDFEDHDEFHLTVGRASLGGAVGGTLAAITTAACAALLPASWGVGSIGWPLLVVGTTAGALSGVAFSLKKKWRALVGALAGGTGACLALASAQYPLFAAMMLGLAAAPILARGTSWKRKMVTASVAGAFGMAGLQAMQWLAYSDLLERIVPWPVTSALMGAAAGLFFGLASVPTHIARPKDPVEGAFRDALAIEDGELHEILNRALTVHQAVRTDLASKGDQDTTTAKLGDRVGELAIRILSIAEQCRRIERDLAAAPAFELEDRIEAMTRKAEAARDESARETYRAAVASLDGQRQAFDTIHRGRERVIARLHANVALLEKVRYSLLHMRNADAERIGGESTALLEAVEEISRELDATSTAVGEVFGRTALPATVIDARAHTIVDSPRASLVAVNGERTEPGSSETRERTDIRAVVDSREP